MPSIDFLSSIIFCASATTFASSQYVVASTIALALSAGSSLLNIPEPTNIPSQPSCICRCGNSSSCKVNHGEPAQSGSFYNQLVGNLQLPCNSHQLLLVSILVDSSYPSYFIINYPHMLDSFCNISSSRFPLCPYHRRSFRDPPESFPQVSCSTDKR